MTEAIPDYQSILSHYEECLQRHGSGAMAVNWKSDDDAAKRYDIMLDLVRDRRQPATLLDFGCGLADLKRHIERSGLQALDYTGLEVSELFAERARQNHPDAPILQMDVLVDDGALPLFDYVVMNGIFTRRHDLSYEAMDAYLRKLIPVAFAHCKVGLAFNVMSKAVDWELPELYHAEPGPLIAFVSQLTRHFVLRNDYGLFETTIYLYRTPVLPGVST